MKRKQYTGTKLIYIIGVFHRGREIRRVAVNAPTEEEATDRLAKYRDRYLPGWKLRDQLRRSSPLEHTRQEIETEKYHKWDRDNSKIGRAKR